VKTCFNCAVYAFPALKTIISGFGAALLLAGCPRTVDGPAPPAAGFGPGGNTSALTATVSGAATFVPSGLNGINGLYYTNSDPTGRAGRFNPSLSPFSFFAMRSAPSFSMHRHFFAFLLLITAVAGCKKDSAAPTPSNTALLTGPTWRTADVRLTINGVEGMYTPTAGSLTDLKFTTDGKYTSTPASGGTASTGTWAFASSETQLIETPTNGTAPPAYQIYTLSSADLGLGYSFTQAQVQHALNNNNTSPTSTDQLILALVLSSSAFTFPNNTPPVSSSAQITTLGFRTNFKAR